MSEEAKVGKPEVKDVRSVLSEEFMAYMQNEVNAKREAGEDAGNAAQVIVTLIIDEDTGELSILQQDVSSGVLVLQDADEEE